MLDRTATSRRLIGRDSLDVGLAAGGIALVVALAIAALYGGRVLLSLGDPKAYHLVAQAPFSNGSHLQAMYPGEGDAYRYGRILYPLLAWVLALGRPGWTEATMVIVNVVAVGACAAVTAEMCSRAGRPAPRGLLILAVPAVGECMGMLFPEALVIGLILLTYLLWSEGRTTAAIAVGATVILAREAAALALLPLVVMSWTSQRYRGVGLWALALVPYGAWITWVRFRVGQWPFLDKAITRREALGLPVVGYVRVLRHSGIGPALLVAILAVAVITLATVGVAVVLVRRWPSSPLAWGALALSLIGPFLGTLAISFPSEALRVLGPAQALILVTVLVNSRPREASAGPTIQIPVLRGQL